VIYQHFNPPTAAGLRPVGSMRVDAAEPVAAALRGGPTRSLILVTGGFMRGAITAFGQALEGHELDLLGLFWYYSGDDITDDPKYAEEIADACRRLRVKKLTILTGALNESTETRLASGLAPLADLRVCRLFEKDEGARYRPFPTPKIEAALAGR